MDQTNLPGEGPEVRREHPRHTLVLPASLAATELVTSDWTENLSAAGLFVRTERLLEPGELVSVRLSFPHLLEPVDVRCKVIWRRVSHRGMPAGVGVQAADEPSRKRLAEIVLRVTNPSMDWPNRTFRMVVAEDNPHMTRIYERVIKQLSTTCQGRIEVSFAANGHEALKTIEQDRTDLVMTDIYMPIMGGFAFIEQMRQKPTLRDLPVIVVTSGDHEESDRARQLGVAGFLQKPVQFGQLLETIALLIGPRPTTELAPP